ncbi:MAG TPA: PPC domain-containing protein [Actinomycetota bacterium]|nr:PPC domain-containing protein [Actinomycetota bacterium]
MRKALATLIALGLVASFTAGPAVAAKKKKKVTKTIEETIDVTAVPFPNYSSSTGTPTPGCSAGQEGVHKLTRAFETPGSGTLTLSMSGFTGDWDLYVLDGGVAVARSDNAQVPDQAPPEEKIEMPLAKGKTYDLVICNWAGAPQASANLKYVYSV